MNITHLAPHYGGGIGTVLSGWLETDKSNVHKVFSLEKMKSKKLSQITSVLDDSILNQDIILNSINSSDVTMIHYWDSPILPNLLTKQLPKCRIVFWVHKNFKLSIEELKYPDLLVGTSPIQGLPQYVWSTGNMDRFFELQPTPHEGFNVGYVGTVDYKKLHSSFMLMLHKIGLELPESTFAIIGDDHVSGLVKKPWVIDRDRYNFTGKVDDVAPYLQSMDVFGYPLRPDHYGTCEQVIGEAMAVGLPVVAMNNSCERTIIQEGVTGYLCNSEEEYIDNIVHLYHKPNLRKWMGQNAREAAMVIYNVDNMVDQWNYIFELMMNEPKKERMPVK